LEIGATASKVTTCRSVDLVFPTRQHHLPRSTRTARWLPITFHCEELIQLVADGESASCLCALIAAPEFAFVAKLNVSKLKHEFEHSRRLYHKPQLFGCDLLFPFVDAARVKILFDSRGPIDCCRPQKAAWKCSRERLEEPVAIRQSKMRINGLHNRLRITD